jgi:MFS family permease
MTSRDLRCALPGPADPSSAPGPAGHLSPRSAYRLATSIVGLCLFASVVPSPLYHAYSVWWHFSSLTLTLIFATYAFGVLASLLLLGRVSDQVGRRPVLLVAVSGLIISSALFIASDSATWLFVSRGVQGLATGAALSAASASMLDLHHRRDPVSVGLSNGVASTAGLGLGTLCSALIVQAGTAVRELPYVMLLVLFSLALAGVYRMPEPVSQRTPLRLTPQRPNVPAGIRHRFALAGMAVCASWSIGGLLFSLGPVLATGLFATTNVVAAAYGAIALGLAAALAQLTLHRVSPWLGATSGSLALALGVGLIVLAARTGSGTTFVVGGIVAGIGFGIAFLGALRNLVVAVPNEHRAAVMSAFYVVAYLSLSVPSVIAGVVVSHLGIDDTFEIFGILAAILALVVAVEAGRTRPRHPADSRPDLAP